MTTLADHTSSEFVKMLFIGSSGTGKTGALISLVEAGYKLRIIDLDNGLAALKNFIVQNCPEKLKNVEYETRRDKYKAGPMGTRVVPPPKAYVESCKLMDKWTDGTDPNEWGSEYVLVIDSMTSLGQAAFEWAKALEPTVKDPRQWYFTAQNAIQNTVAGLTSDLTRTNVIIISHIDLVEDKAGMIKGFASTIGKALGPKIPLYFDTLLLMESMGSGTSVRRTIKTTPTGLIDVKNPAPMRIDATYPLETGLAEIFEKLKGE